MLLHDLRLKTGNFVFSLFDSCPPFIFVDSGFQEQHIGILRPLSPVGDFSVDCVDLILRLVLAVEMLKRLGKHRQRIGIDGQTLQEQQKVTFEPVRVDGALDGGTMPLGIMAIAPGFYVITGFAGQVGAWRATLSFPRVLLAVRTIDKFRQRINRCIKVDTVIGTAFHIMGAFSPNFSDTVALEIPRQNGVSEKAIDSK